MTGRAPLFGLPVHKTGCRVTSLQLLKRSERVISCSSVAALSTTCPHFCPDWLQVLHNQRRKILKSLSGWFLTNCQVERGFPFFTLSYWSLLSKPCVVLWEIIPEKSISKSTPVFSDYGSGNHELLLSSYQRTYMNLCVTIMYLLQFCAVISFFMHSVFDSPTISVFFAQIFSRRNVSFDEGQLKSLKW